MKSILRVLMIVENNTYPSDTRVRQEAETLVNAGHLVSVICPRGDGQPWRESINNVQVFRFPMLSPGGGLIAYAVEFIYATIVAIVYVLWRWIADGLDVIHVHNPPDTLFACGLLPKCAGKTLVYDQHDLAPELYLSKYEYPRPLIWRILLILEGLSMRFADAVITANESYRKLATDRHGLSPDRCWVVRNGPDLNRIHLVAPDPEIRSHAKTIIGYVGNISTQDGLDHLLLALHHLRQDLGYEDWFCVVVGPADNLAALELLCAELDLTTKVRFTGYASGETLLAYLSAADICVVPDPSSPLNDRSTMIKIMEYMALEKPVVAYDLGEHRVSAGEAALYARPNEPADMASQLAHLIDEPAERARLGAIGRRRVEEHLAWPYSAQRLVSLYKKLGKKPRSTIDRLDPVEQPVASVEVDPGENR